MLRTRRLTVPHPQPASLLHRVGNALTTLNEILEVVKSYQPVVTCVTNITLEDVASNC